ncbi:hypothetical protein V6N12_013371 [Hibiscus sabdariffa]|uniref:Uncharacterized protein n=1 Tax=Hibiscus sabdariffa TaxID=183260 RepID=A0ABR2D6B0_9ROSI
MDPPALSPNDEDIPHCFIFATFMLSSMLGSSVASRLLAHQSSRPESYMQTVFTISSVSLLLPVVTNVHSTIFSLCPRFHFHVISFSQQLGGKTVNYELTVLYQTVFGSTVKRERWEHLVFWMYPTHWFLHIRSLRWDILAIYHEDEVHMLLICCKRNIVYLKGKCISHDGHVWHVFGFPFRGISAAEASDADCRDAQVKITRMAKYGRDGFRGSSAKWLIDFRGNKLLTCLQHEAILLLKQ